MREFKDSSSDTWQIDLPFGEVVRVLKESDQKFNLLQPDKLGEVLDSDLLAFYDLLRVLLEPQAKAKSVDPLEFGKRMAGACIVAAQQAFFAEWVDFFRQLHRHDQARGVEFLVTNHQKGLELLKAKMEANEPEIKKIEALAHSKMNAALETSFGNLRAELAMLATPSSAHGENSNATPTDAVTRGEKCS